MPENVRIHLDLRQHGMEELWEAQLQQEVAFRMMVLHEPGSQEWVYWSQVQREAGWRIMYEQAVRGQT